MFSFIGFLEKNNNTLQSDLMLLLSFSSNQFIQNLLLIKKNSYTENLVSIHPETKNQIKNVSSQSESNLSTITTVSGQFRTQLESLMSTLRSTNHHYIKCIKPNASKTCKIKYIYIIF